ncbi:MAG TPA: AMP-binding protein [Chitinivibrionales bacterium]|nr:AMP-binding protein [Chitinivibrionales bacterium]
MNKHVYADLLNKSMNENASRPCMHIKRKGEYQSWTYADFRRDVNQLASALRKKGYSNKDTIVVIGDNTPEWVLAWHCGFLAGGKTVPVDPNLPAPEIREIVSQVKPKFVFCSKGFIKLFDEIKAESKFISAVIVDDKDCAEAKTTFAKFIADGDPAQDAFARQFNPDDVAVIIFTSGTTGKAKGVMLTQRNFTATPLSAIPRMKAGPGDTMMAVLPLHHVFGACANLPGALGGGLDIVLIPTIKGSLILDGLREKKVTMLPAVPKLLQMFYNNINQNVKSKGPMVRAMFAALTFVSATLGRFLGQDFRRKLFSSVHKGFGGRLNIVISGGAAITKNVFTGFKLMGFRIVEGYGLSETFGAITLCPIDDPRLGSVGVPLDENEVRIDKADAAGIGEICFRGANVFAGYLNNEELTKKSFDADGWFHTGDLGRLDKDGFIYIVGRSKDIIVLDSGKNVYPDELEDFYSASESIEEIGVFSAKVKGKEIAAALILPSQKVRRNHTLSEAAEVVRNEVLRLGRDLPSYKKITDFAVVYDPLPRTTTKKLKKHELRELYYSLKESDEGRTKKQAVSAAESSLMATAEYKSIAMLAAKTANLNESAQLPPFFNLELELGLDSMKKLDFLSLTERRFSIVFSDDDLVRLETLGDVYTAVMDQLSAAKGAETIDDIKQRIVGSTQPAPYPAKGAAVFTNALPAITHAASSMLWNVTASGNVGVPEAGTPVIFCANRQSVLDPLWVMYSLPPAVRKKTFIIGGRDLLPVLLHASLSGNIVPVKREGDVAAILRASIAVLKDGNNLLVFPESGQTKTGELRKFKSGIGLLMLSINATVLPVRVRGTFAVWPLGGFPKFFIGKKASPTITFGQPLTFQGLIDKGKITAYSTADQIAGEVRNIIAEMS